MLERKERKPQQKCNVCQLHNNGTFDIMWKIHGRARQDIGDNTVRRVSFAFWMNKATDTPESVITYCFSTAAMVTLRSFLLRMIERTKINVCSECRFCEYEAFQYME